MWGTRGTETSKYPEEKKSTEIPRVVASESGRGQTKGSNTFGVGTEPCIPERNRRAWESLPKNVRVM